MTIAISIDEYIFEAEGKFYGDNVGYDIVKRYADIFENIKLISRIKHVDANHLEMHNKLLTWDNVSYIDERGSIINGETIKIFNYGNCKRDFTYVDDIVEGIIRVMQGAPEKQTGEDGLPIPDREVRDDRLLREAVRTQFLQVIGPIVPFIQVDVKGRTV